MALRLISPPTVEPVSLEEAYFHLRLDPDVESDDSPPGRYDDVLIAAQIAAARDYCERWLGRALAVQTYEATFDAFKPRMELPMPPLLAVSTITYTDPANTQIVLDSGSYVVDNYSEPGVVVPSYTNAWPATYSTSNAVVIRFIAGYQGPDESPLLSYLPPALKAAILLVLGALYENRENDSGKVLDFNWNGSGVLAAQALMRPYQVRLSMA